MTPYFEYQSITRNARNTGQYSLESNFKISDVMMISHFAKNNFSLVLIIVIQVQSFAINFEHKKVHIHRYQYTKTLVKVHFPGKLLKIASVK